MPNKSAPEIELIHKKYNAFKARNIETTLATTTPDIGWPKAFEGSYIHGDQAVRA